MQIEKSANNAGKRSGNLFNPHAYFFIKLNKYNNKIIITRNNINN